MAATKDLFIHSISQIQIDGEKNIPTCLYYSQEDTPLFGLSAKDECKDPFLLNQDFKVDLGRHDSTRPRHNQRFQTACGTQKSAAILAGDFIDAVLVKVDRWLADRNVEQAAHILLAEPLAMHAEEDTDWLTNYRRNLTEMLRSRQHVKMPHLHFSKVDFLPEPFAVFQYYRYGINHPLMSQAIKHQSLILDFGGGTFDVCIVETTKQGDISQSGRNSKPLGASSEPVGGYEINRRLAYELFRESLGPGMRDQCKHGIQLYSRWRRGEVDLETARPDLRNFAINFHRTAVELEEAKLALCRQVTNWNLDAALTQRTPIRLPVNPFTENPATKSVPLSATQLRTVFLDKIWQASLRGVVKRTFERAAEDLQSQPVSIVLLSGGSANIGWLETLLWRDFSKELANAQIVKLPDYQEVVSKGLAVECTRRFFTDEGEGDFGSVTYNRLCLMLDVNRTEEQSDCRPRPFSPITDGLPSPDAPGVLLPSASTLNGMLDRPLRWRVRQLGGQPKRLDYFFLRAGLDPEDLESRLNFEETHVDAPPRTSFDQDLKVELRVREDGTALPRFIYKTGRTEEDHIDKIGKAFALDMTCTANAKGIKAYVGFDFGTSNSSVSYVDNASITAYQKRKSEASWGELSEIAYQLPYPAAEPILRYLECSSGKSKEIADAARQAIEGVLATGAYSALADYRFVRSGGFNRGSSTLLKQLSQRSLGPLWGFLRTLLGRSAINFGPKAEFIAPLAELFSSELETLLNDAVTMMGEEKHEKSLGFDCHRPLYVAANILRRTFQKTLFGFFEQIEQDAFSEEFCGHFRVAHGHPPFIRTLPVRLERSVPNRMPYLLNLESRKAISLKPLLFWKQIDGHHSYDHGHCFLFDLPERDGSTFSFKAVGIRHAERISITDDRVGALARELSNLRHDDGQQDAIQLTHIDMMEE